MAITVENATPINRYDRFKVQCPRCGRELSYSRRDVLAHRRWPNGFIYCPGCKTPIGHREDNFIESGEEYEAKEIARKQEIRKETAKKFSKEELENDIEKYSKQRKLFFALGIPLMSVGLIAVMVVNYISIANPGNEGLFASISTLLSFVFAGGLVLFILALVLGGKIKQRRGLLAAKESEEKPAE